MFLKLKGSITVFAALCMSVVIMVLSVIIQSVAVYSGMHIADESTRLACKAVMSGFNREILDNYHVFVLDLGAGQSKVDKNKLKDNMNSYLYGDNSNDSDVNLTGTTYSGIDTIQYTYIADDKGEYFTDQVVQYMKYKVGKDFVAGYLRKFGLMSNNKCLIEAGKEQASLAEKAEKISEDIMKLYSCVDGFKVKGTQAVYDSDGDLEFNDKFLKIIVSDDSSKEAMGYSENDFYNVRKRKSFCLLYKMDVLQKQLRRWMKAIDDNNSDRKKFCKKKCASICDELEKSLDISIDCCDEALGIIKKIENDRKKYNKQKEEYDKYLNEHKDELGQDVYDSLSIVCDDIEVLDNLDELKECITDNKEKLMQMKDTLDFTLKNDKGSLNHSLAVAELIIMYAKDYSVENICFNYENLEMESDSESVAESLLEVFEEGIISLVTDTDKLSKGLVKSGGLVSKSYMSNSKSSVAGMIEDALDEGISKLPGNVYYAVKSMLMEVKDIEGLLLAATDEIIDSILMNEYIMQDFNHYNVNKEDVNTDINNVLEYEAEYIIAGNMTDMANIKAVVNRLIMIRTILNYISIVSDPAKHYEAKGIAMSLVGFSSMPVIVNVATCIIEVLWAYEEALVDCNALLKGYYVPVAKQGSQLKIGIGELLLLSKTLVNKKAEDYSSNKNVFGMLDYKSYVELFLLLTPKEEKALRCMDLVQVNINNTYGTNMRMTNAVYAVSVKTKYNIRMLFLNMNQMKTLNKDMTGIREYISAGAFSY